MRIRIVKGGIFGANGEIPVGTEMTVSEEPKAWGNRYQVISAGKVAVTNPAKDPVKQSTDDTPKTAVEVLAMANDGTHFQTFRSEAHKLLGEATPGSKDEIVAALDALATDPGNGSE